MNPLAADSEFFAALIKGDTLSLGRLLTDDFLLIEVMGGSEVSKGALLTAIEAKQIEFKEVGVTGQHVRRFESTALVTGRTRMTGLVGAATFAIHSRYTHVFVTQRGAWHLASAQGTPIAVTS